MTLSATLRVIRASAGYDLLVTAVFALPWTAAATFHGLGLLHHALGLSGALPSADSVFTVLFANLMGSLVTVWSVLRLARPSLQLGLADTAARFLFSFGFALALAGGASTILVPLLIVELAWGVSQGAVVGLAIRRQAQASRVEP